MGVTARIPGDLAGGDRDADTRAAEEQRAVGLAGGDESRPRRSRSAGRRCGRRRRRPTSMTRSTRSFASRSLLQDLLVVESGVIAADDDAQRLRQSCWSLREVVGAGQDGGDGCDDEAERVRPGVGGSEALLGVRSGAAHARQQVGGGARQQPRRPRRRVARRSRGRHRRRPRCVQRVAERHEGVDHRLVARPRPCRTT